MTKVNQRCLENHQNFRILLQAMSRPGTICSLTAAKNQRQALLQLLDTLLDQQASFALFAEDPEFVAHLQSLTGSRLDNLQRADFLLALTGSSFDQLRRVKRGRLEFPDEGATVVFAVESISETESKGGLALSGPGIQQTVHRRIQGIDPQDLVALQEINSDFPLGIDAVFIDRAGQLFCIPRSTRIGGLDSWHMSQ